MHIVEEFPRLFSIETYGKVFETPFFIPAISSLKTNWRVSVYLDLIKKVVYPGFLISAYDIHKLENKETEILVKNLSDCADKGTLVFLDNGNYEAYWYKDQTWNLDNIESVLERVSPDFCFSFDIFWDKGKKVEKHIKETITSIAKTAGMQRAGSTIALVHSNRELFPKVIGKIVGYINPEIVAIPERELGSSIFDRSRTIKAIRDELGKTKKPIPIHVLGTGHPISILIYTLCGADMYDALVWCTECIDPETGRLFHFSQKDLIDCQCEACKLKQVSYEIQTMTHNLIFYLEFLEKIRASIRNGKVESILNEYLNERDATKVKRIMGSNE